MTPKTDPNAIPLPPSASGAIPKKGLQQAVCAFVESMGEAVSPFVNDRTGEHPIQPKLVICWELREKMDDGRPFMLSKTYTLSSHPKASLMGLLTAWLEKPPTAEQIRLGTFNLRSLIGMQAMVNVAHVEKDDGSKRASIESVAGIMDGLTPLVVHNDEPPEWIAKQRAENAAGVAAARRGGDKAAGSADFDEVPF